VRWRLALFVVLGLAALPTSSGGARPTTSLLIDCTCYDISQVDTTHKALFVLQNGGFLGWNLFDVSPHRTRVLFTHGDLRSAGIDGGTAFRDVLAPQARYGTIRSAAFSPNGQWGAFSADGCGLCVVPARGGKVQNLGIQNAFGWPSWAPDSKRLVVPVRLSADSSDSELILVNVDGPGERALTGPLPGVGLESFMARSMWSPTGDRIVYSEGHWDQRRLHVLRLADGSDKVIAEGSTAVWSHDGTKLAFMWKNRELAVVDADGGHLHVLDPHATDSYLFGAAWSPGGRWIAYRTTSNRGENGADNLMLAYADGSHRRMLVRGDPNEEIGPIYWSLNGQTILYTHLVQTGE